MGKMYYSEEESAEKLKISPEQLAQLAADGKLQQFADGAQKMYKAGDVDALALAALAESTGEIELAPAEASGQTDIVDISEADKDAQRPGKADTVLTSQGISVFDDEDLEIGSGDPMAKTTIAPSTDDVASLEGVGSGSGLLDLTRESDDTSLGEVLEHIDVESVVPSGPPVVDVAEEAASQAQTMMYEAPTVMQELDASTGAFSGLILAACIIMLPAALAAMAALLGQTPSYLLSFQVNLGLWLVCAVVVAGLLTLAGYLIGKSAATRAAAMQRGV